MKRLGGVWSRREFCLATLASSGLVRAASADQTDDFRLNYILASCLFGYQYLGEILPQVRATGATAIDIWPKVHGNQRQQLTDLGEEKFAAMLRQHNVQLGCLTQYPLGPFGLQDEIKLAGRLGCGTIVTGGRGPRGLSGTELKSAVKRFLDLMKPHLAVAEQHDVTIAIENHANNLIESPDSLKWLAELRPSKSLGIALAPYHLPQAPEQLGRLIESLGDSIVMFYAWQHGMGCHKKLPKHQELLQLPGRGQLDFGPLLAALKKVRYAGWTEIFMHPVPRGVPMLPMAANIADELNRSRSYLDAMLD